jgi:flavin reductase (DIM6/NTAB) family NADH-FMN oxidoreductase RutF
MSVDANTLRHAMRQWASGVSIVSARHAEQQHGMTVNSFISVSLEPPRVLVSLERGRHTHELVERSGYFGVSVLSDQHKELSDRFAGRLTESGDRFAGLETFRLVTETPLLSVALAAFDCRVIATHPVGTHTLFIGEVLAIQNQEGGSPLLYFNQAYHKLNDGG